MEAAAPMSAPRPDPVAVEAAAGEIFLSYHSPDREAVLKVRKLLATRGIPTFLDRDNLVAGMPWPQALEQGLEQSGAVAVFLGGHGIGLWQKREIGFALERQVRAEQAGKSFPVIPVLLSGADPTPGFLFLNTWIDLRRDPTDPEMIDALARAMLGNATGASGAASREGAEPKLALCPYRGMRAFREEDSALFFGREGDVERLLEAARRHKFVAVVGPSGSGKSSIVQAGLIPKLRVQHPPSPTWDVVSFIPGDRPFHQLAAALIATLEPDLSETDRLAEGHKLGERLATGEVPLDGVIARMIQKSGGTDRLLLVVDQFEEVFNRPSDSERRAFVSRLLGAMERAPVTVLITLRASFYAPAIAFSRELSESLERGVVNLGTMQRGQLQRSIVEPARRVAIKFEQGLVERILDDVGGEPGSLSLLEFALTELWARRQDRLLTHAAYDAIGRVDGAVDQRAEELFTGLGPDQQLLARRVFTRLWMPSGPDGAQDVRQRASISELGQGYWVIIKALADARLVVTGRDAATGQDTVEVAHEGLIRNWPRLRAWLAEDKEFLLWRQKLRSDVAEWAASGKDPAGLLRGRQLEDARRWRGERADELTAPEVEFIRQGELGLERDLLGRVHRQRRLLLAAGASAVVLLILASVAWLQWRIADQQRSVLASKQAAFRAISQISIDPELSLLLAMAGLDVADTPEAEDALRQAVLESHLRVVMRHSNVVTSVALNKGGNLIATAAADQIVRVWEAGSGKKLFELPGQASVAFSPDGGRLLTAGSESVARTWEAATGKKLLELGGHVDDLKGAVWSPDGKLIVTASRDGSARVWNGDTGAPVGKPLSHGGVVNAAAVSPDGKLVVTGGTEGAARLWNTGSGSLAAEFRNPGGGVNAVAFSPDGKWLAITTENMPVTLLQSVTGRQSFKLQDQAGTVSSIAFSPDGKRLATATTDDTQLWDVASGKLLSSLGRHTDSVVSVAFSPDGRHLVTAGYDGLSVVWDVARGAPLVELRGHTDGITAAAFSADGKRVVTAGRDRTARVWDAVALEDSNALTGHGSAVVSVGFSPDGGQLLTGSSDNTARLWDAGTRRMSRELRGHLDSVAVAQFSPDGKRVLTASRDGTAALWESASGKRLAQLKGHASAVRAAAFSPDGKWIATASNDAKARLWDAATGQALRELSGHTDRIYALAFSPDSRLVATGSADNTARVWSTDAPAAVLELKHQDGVRKLAFNADGKLLATGTRDGMVQLWELSDGKPGAQLAGHTARVTALSFNRDGRLLLTAAEDGTARIWEVPSGRPLQVLARHIAQVSAAEFSPDGRLVVTASWDMSARLWETATGKLLRDLRGHRGRVLAATFSPDGTRVATASRDGTARVWTVALGAAGDTVACDACGMLAEVIELAKKHVTRTLTPQEQRQYLNAQ
jgi:WD40 repeat protein